MGMPFQSGNQDPARAYGQAQRANNIFSMFNGGQGFMPSLFGGGAAAGGIGSAGSGVGLGPAAFGGSAGTGGAGFGIGEAGLGASGGKAGLGGAGGGSAAAMAGPGMFALIAMLSARAHQERNQSKARYADDQKTPEFQKVQAEVMDPNSAYNIDARRRSDEELRQLMANGPASWGTW